MAFNYKKHDKVYDDALEDIRENVYDNIKALENEVAEIVAQGLTAETVRPMVMQAFTRHSQEVKSAAQPLTMLSEDFLKQSDIPVGPTDYTVQNTLLNLGADELSSTLEGGGEDVVKTIVLATVAGLATATIVDQVRGRISGIHMESKDPNVRKEQRKLRKLVKTGAKGAAIGAVQQSIKSKLGNINTAASVGTRMSTLVNNVVGEFNGTFSKARAASKNIKMFEYVGGIMATSRPFCVSMLGSRMSEEEIQNIWDGEHWDGKEPGDAFVVRGGYNCRHYWVPLEESYSIEASLTDE